MALVINCITRTATVTVAASDASTNTKTCADYVCIGTNDHLVLQTALDALPASGGELRLSEGLFHLGATLTRAIDNVTISGAGFSTYLIYNGSTPVISCGIQKYWLFKDLRLDYGGLQLYNGSKWTLNNIWRNSPINGTEYVDFWAEDHIAPRSAESLQGVINRHPLVKTLDDMQTEDWTADKGTLTWDTDIKYMGTKSIKMVTHVGNGTSMGITKMINSKDLTNCCFNVMVYTPDYTKIESVGLHINTGAGDWVNYGYFSSSNVQTVNNEWFCITINRLAASGSPDFSNATKLRVRVLPKTGMVATAYIGKITCWKKVLTPKGAVTFTFDDGYDSVYDIARPAMDKYGYKGVHGVIVGKLDNDKITKARMLQRIGWDVVSHSYNHDPDTTKVLNDPEWEYMLAQKWLADNGFKSGSRFVILYGGLHNEKMIRLLDKNMCLTRSSLSGAIGGFNSLPNTGNLLYSQVCQASTTIATIQGWIDIAKNEGLWLVLMFHEIVPSNPVSLQISSELFGQIVDYCNMQGVEVLTFSDVVNRIKNPIIENTGSGTISSGSTSVNIRHGFYRAPKQILITLTSGLGNTSSIYVSSKDNGTGNLFTVSVNTNPEKDVTFDWRAIL